MQQPLEPPPPLPWNARSWLLFYALGASVLYAGSFTLVLPTERVIRQAWLAVGAAALSLTVLIVLLSMATRGRVGPLSWLDAVLLALRVGFWVSFLGVIANLGVRRGAGWLYAYLGPLHLAIIGAANLAMITVFARRAQVRGLDLRRALLYWLAFANGLFALLYSVGGWLG